MSTFTLRCDPPIADRAGSWRESLRRSSRMKPRTKLDIAKPLMGLTQVKEFAHDGLKGISLEVDQDKQELIFGSRQEPLAAPANRTSPGLTLGGLACRMDSLMGPWKGCQQTFNLR